MSMANSNLQIGRYRRSINDQGVCGTGFQSKDTIKFSRAFTEAPTVLTTIYQYEICNNGANMRASTWVESTDPTGFSAVATTWGDTQLYAIGVQVCITCCRCRLHALFSLAVFEILGERALTCVGNFLQWIAVSKNLMVRPQQYFPLVPVPQDSVASSMCFGTMCVDAKKWKDIMNMANWRVEAQTKEYKWECNHRTATWSFTFSEAFEEVPDVKLYVNKLDECGWQDFKWTLDVKKVTTAGFDVELYGLNMYSVGFHWVALSKDLTESQ